MSVDTDGFRPTPEHYGQLTDIILASRIARGDVAALEILYNRHGAMILRMMLEITRDRSLAEDVLQETFWRVWQGAKTYQFVGGTFTAWLFSDGA